MKICQQVKNRWGLSLHWYYHGLIYAELNRFIEAITWLERSVDISHNYGIAIGLWYLRLAWPVFHKNKGTKMHPNTIFVMPLNLLAKVNIRMGKRS